MNIVSIRNVTEYECIILNEAIMCSKHNSLFIFFFSLESFPETFTGYLVETRDVRQECDPVGSCKKKKKKLT